MTHNTLNHDNKSAGKRDGGVGKGR